MTLIYEYKLDGTQAQYAAIDEVIRVCQFIRNKCLRKWMDGRGIGKYDLNTYCAVLAKEYPFGYYCQFAVDAERHVEHTPTGKQMGIDMGLKEFLTDSQGNTIANPRHPRVQNASGQTASTRSRKPRAGKRAG